MNFVSSFWHNYNFHNPMLNATRLKKSEKFDAKCIMTHDFLNNTRSCFSVCPAYFQIGRISENQVLISTKVSFAENRTGSDQRWPESLFQTPTPLLFQNFRIQIRSHLWIRLQFFRQRRVRIGSN